MTALAAAYFVAALVLAVAGAAKVLEPADTARALRLSGIPASSAVVRVGAAVEVALGAGALSIGGPVLAALVAASYVAFAGFVVVALVRGTPVRTCGCLGRADTPPSWLHVGIDLVLAGVAAGAAGAGIGGLADECPGGALATSIFLAVVVAGTVGCLAALTSPGRSTRTAASGR